VGDRFLRLMLFLADKRKDLGIKLTNQKSM
jgi:hypothetical protein